MRILFINGSPNHHGNTAALAAVLLKGKEYKTLNLTDYTIGAYWHNICGSVRNVLDRFYGKVANGELSGRRLYFVFQGAAPEEWMLDAGEYTMQRFAGLYGMTYGGMVSSKADAEKLNQTI